MVEPGPELIGVTELSLSLAFRFAPHARNKGSRKHASGSYRS